MSKFSTRIGTDELGREVRLDLADPWHLVVQGQSRGGKSVLVYGLLASAASSPEIVVAGCDPTGIMLNPFTQADNPEWRSMRNTDVTAHKSVLRSLVRELDERIDRLLLQDRDKLDAFSAEQPLIVVLMEEYPGLLAAAEADDMAEGRKPTERIAPAIQRDLRRLIQEGAKVGFRVLLLAQRADASIIGGSERSNFGIRVTMRVDNPDAVEMLHPSIDSDLTQRIAMFSAGTGVLDRPGERLALFRSNNTSYADYVNRVRTSLMDRVKHENDHYQGELA